MFIYDIKPQFDQDLNHDPFITVFTRKIVGFGHSRLCEGERVLLNKESTRSLLSLFEMRNTSCTNLEVQHNNVKESVLY